MFYWITNLAAIFTTVCFFGVAWLMDRRVGLRFTTVNITLLATLCALSVVLTNVVGYSRIFGLRIMIGNFILFLTGMIFGPFAGVLIGVVTDGVGAIVHLGGTYHAGFMVAKIFFGFFGSLVFLSKTNKFWQLKVVFLLGIAILLQLFVIAPISFWSTGGVGYVFTSLIKKAIIFPVELVLYPFLTISTFRILYLLLLKIPNNKETVWAIRNGDLRFFLKTNKQRVKRLALKEKTKWLDFSCSKPEKRKFFIISRSKSKKLLTKKEV